MSRVVSHHWVKIAAHPPTYFPRGVSANVPTTLHHGEWVETGDARGSRYFIPFKLPAGTSRRSLIEEAQSARTVKRLRQIQAEDAEMLKNRTIDSTKSAPLIALGTIATLGFCPTIFVDTEWREGWNKQWQDQTLPARDE